MSPKKDSPKAKSWDKLSQQKARESNANRDVYNDQQLDRSEIGSQLSKAPRAVAAALVGLLMAIAVWTVWSLGHWGWIEANEALGRDAGSSQEQIEDAPTYVAVEQGEGFLGTSTYYHLDADGEVIEEPTFDSEDAARAEPPQWFQDWMEENSEAAPDEDSAAGSEAGSEGALHYLLVFNWWKLFFTVALGLGVFGILHTVLMRKLAAQNLMHDTKDINQHEGDQHIALPEEIQRKFSWFPDVGAHSSVQPSSLISHVMLTNKGLKKVELAQRAQKDMFDEDGDVEYYKGQILLDGVDKPKTKTAPMIDEEFGDDLFSASGLPEDKVIRKKFNAKEVEYNPGGKNREKTGKYKTVADLINQDWDFPLYEPQRPGGAYIVDEAPVNTMVLAITRAGKGQTYIEPMLDMWLREKNPNNMVVNDPKGELLVKNYVRATMRGYQVVQFNLINAMKTDIYNPLAMAAESARAGDITKCAMYVENIANVFFPVDGGEDPVWPNAANNAFKRAAFGLIDYYMEQERELRAYALRVNMDPKVLDTMLDERWGKVTLYNCYQLFVRLTAKKAKNPMKQVEEQIKNGEFGDDESFDQDAHDEAVAEAQSKEFIWDGQPEIDMLTLYFNATNALPTNQLREEVSNADNALRSMGAAEKMLASVYGIAITAMSFFTDPTIRTLTSGTPSQNVDLAGMSFPRRIGVRFHANYLERDHLIGAQAKWEAYSDELFTEKLDGEFEHEDMISREGWARYYFKGIFPQRTVYLKLRLLNAQSGMLLRTFYFRFTKEFQTTLDGRRYVTDPITGEKIVKDGVLVELKPVSDEEKTRQAQQLEDARHEEAVAQYKADPRGKTPPVPKVAREAGTGSYAVGHTTYPQMRLVNLTMTEPEKEMGQTNAIISNSVRYSEKPKAVFLVTPPHLMKYAKLILILVKQLVDLNFDQSYMTKNNQKPLYKTRFMLDELGNLQSEGQGISGFETMLSIGLGQEQQFTIILQTLQQLKEVYGDSVDKIVQGNTSNIVFLKSTDDSMIETLEKMSGKRHKAYIESKTVTRDTEAVLKFTNVEGKASYTMSVKEEPVIKYNDMAFLAERNSIVFRAGDAPIWNRNETILPMSWRLFKNTIEHPGHSYSLKTIPTLSSAIDFDVRANTPDFEEMLSKRVRQAQAASLAVKTYKEVYDYSDAQIDRLDPDVYADEIMEIVDVTVREEEAAEQGVDSPDAIDPSVLSYSDDMNFDIEENTEQKQVNAEMKAAQEGRQDKRYAEGLVNAEMLTGEDERPTGYLDDELVETFKALERQLSSDEHFQVDGAGNLRSADGSQVYIERLDDSEAKRQASAAATDEGSRAYAEDPEAISEIASYQVNGVFYSFLASKQSWLEIADGEFDQEMAKQIRIKESV